MRTKTMFLICLLLAMWLQPLYGTVLATELPTAGDVLYHRVATAYPLINAASINDFGFLTKFIGADNNSVFNVAPGFTKNYASGAAKAPSSLSFGTTFRHQDDSNTYDVEYQYQLDSQLAASIKKGDLQVALLANLTNDQHWNAKRHLQKKTAYPVAWLQTWSKILIEHETSDYGSDTTKTMGKYHFVPIGSDPYLHRLYFGARGQVCTCGSSKVSNISVILADTVGPRVTSVLASSERGDGSLSFRPGEIMYLTLNFDEPIRFADDQAMSLANAPKLQLELRGVTDNLVQNVLAEATLISLDRDKLTFAYQVPASYQTPAGTIKANHYISAIAPYEEQTSWVSSEHVFNLKLFGKDGASGNYLNHNSNTSSLIVDLAGNPLDIARSTRSLQTVAYLDGIDPTVTSIEIAGLAGASGEATVSDVYARVGERLGCFVQFSEPVQYARRSDGATIAFDSGYLDGGRLLPGAKNMMFVGGDSVKLLAELNIQQAGVPLTATARYLTNVRLKDGRQASRIYFETNEPVNYSMSPLVYAGGAELPVAINRIYLDAGSADKYCLSDAGRNPYASEIRYLDVAAENRLLPKQQLWLDFGQPTATTSLTASGGKYQPLTYGVAANATAFCFPVLVSDPAAAGTTLPSGSNGVTGYFTWRDMQDLPPPYIDSYPFEYAVTGSSEQPDDSDYLPAMTSGKYPFIQIDSGSFLHIRFVDDVDYNFATSQLTIYPVDNANNQGEVAFTLDFVVDRRPPVIMQQSSSTDYYSSGSIRAAIRVQDVSALSNLEYQWTGIGAAPTDDAWLPVTAYSSKSDQRYRYYDFSLRRTGLAAGINHAYRLHVRCTDAAGHSSAASFEQRLDLSFPAYNLEFATDPSQPHGRHSLLLSSASGEQAADVVWVLIRQPKRPYPYQDQVWYWRKVINMSSIGAASVDLLSFDAALSGWHSCDVMNVDMWRIDETGNEVWRPAKIYSDRGLSDKAAFTNYLQQYGPLEVTIIARQDWQHYLPDLIFFDEIYATNSYTFQRASADLIGETETINRITITPESSMAAVGIGREEVLAVSPGQLVLPRSLDGAAFRVSLGNARYAAYGLRDIDFASDDTVFELYQTGAGASEAPLFCSRLVAKASQEIAIPAGVATTGGSYKVVVSVKARGSDHVDRLEYTDILVDRREPSAYGVSQVTTRQPLGELGELETSTAYAVTSNGPTGTVLVSAQPDAEQTVQFSAEVRPLTIGGQAHYATYLRVWNETSAGLLGEGVAYPWIYLPGQRNYRTVLLSATNRDQVLAALASREGSLAATLPILPGQNVIKYQLALPGGYLTPEQTLLLDAATEAPLINLQLSPKPAAGLTTSGDVLATIGLLTSQLVDPETLQLGVLHEPALSAEFASARQVSLSENGAYCFYAVDKFHNVGYQTVTVDYIDRQGPLLEVNDRSDAALNRFEFLVRLADDFGTDGCQLFISFDDAYSRLLGVQPGTVFPVPLADRWQATSAATSGLYDVTTAAAADGAKVVNLSGAFKYDPAVAAPATAERTITLYAVDRAGNQSDKWVQTVEVPNQPTTYVGGELAPLGFAATFSRPVLLTTPQEADASQAYTTTKQPLPFYNNGTYRVDCMDIFGYRYSGNVVVDQYAALYAHSVAISETAPTNQAVQIVLNAAFNLALSLQLPPYIPGGEITPVLDSDGVTVGAVINLQRNGSFSYGLQPRDAAYPKETRTLMVQNIDREPPEVALDWVYTAEIVAGQTAGEVIVSLRGNEELQGLENSGTTHTFTVSDQQPFVFHYADLAGNDGYLTAIPPVKIVGQELRPADSTPPDYELAVYRSEGGSSSKVAGYTKAAYEELTAAGRAEAFPLFSGVLQLRFTPYDENQVTLSLAGDKLEGVSTSGWTVSVADNLDFTVLLTDAVGNQTLVPISITGADHTPPVGTVSYRRTAPYVIRGYLEMTDEGGRPVSLKNTSGVLVETVAGQDRYYHEFRDNESFTFVFMDAAGNIGSTVAVVSSLDMSPPSGTVAQWAPYFVDEHGTAHPGVLTDRPTNANVSVYLQFNKPIQSLTPQVVSGELQDIALAYTADSATVVFRQNAELSLEFMAQNGRGSRLTLTVDVIDKQAPLVTASQTATNLKSVTYSFTANEPVFFLDGEDVARAAVSFSRVFTLNGDYDLRFTDLAGNSTTLRITVSGIDRTPPSLTISGLPKSGAGLTNQPVSFSASLDEPGTIAFRGATYQLAAGQVQRLTASHNGSYQLVATDRVGLTTSYQVVIDCIDRTPPEIRLPGVELLIRQGSDATELAELLLTQAVVTDNTDRDPLVWVDNLTASDLESPGERWVTILARDQAGNEQSVATKVRVYGLDELQVRVNGLLAPSGGTLFVSTRDSKMISVAMANLPTGSGGEEPYQIYWRRGLATAAQMKQATRLVGDSFTAWQDGFYTIYVVTQSKASLLTHIYVQG